MSISTNSMRNRFSPTGMFGKTGSESPPTHLALSSPPIKHWSHTCHETALSSNDSNYSIHLNLAGGADNWQFVYFNESLSALKNNKSTATILKGGKIDLDEIIVEIEQHHVGGCTLADVQYLIEMLTKNGKAMRLKTVKSGTVRVFSRFYTSLIFLIRIQLIANTPEGEW